jgi:DNA-binding response OmpR family regulator
MILQNAREEVEAMAQEKILIIDDDPSFLEITGAILRRFGYEVLTADGVQEGKRLLEAEKPNLLILDIMMATIDEGLQFASSLRQNQQHHRLPIIIVSAQPEIEKGYGRKLDDDLDWIAADIFMEKPVDPQHLRHNIELLLQKQSVSWC